jgi:CRISPR-associated protein Cmr5
MSEKIKDLEKERAEFAFGCVEEVVNEYDKDPKTSNEYKSYCKKIPTMIQTNGLSATLAFMYSKKGTYEIIYNQIEKWLKNERKLKDNNEELVRWIVHLDSLKYKYITSEVMALFLWLKRFADGMIEKEEDGKEKKEEE